ncbi:hypothetical protein LWI28_012114 [Acer negundo]|uniref:non-specific serine/threonine protein kinase n=1 Tax=Acer negundo TaxID=4023 RepID=A0AAD5NS82_ACENE|nr:hypothetical protein LWI28_012114 [Acer negundo]
MLGLRIKVFLLSALFQFLIIAAVTNPQDAAILKSLKDIIVDGLPPNWQGSDPCGDQWEGIECSRSRVTAITLSSMGLKGSISGDITGLSELLTLDLSNNKGLKGSLPSSIENLRKLTNLILVGCSLSGPIPDSIGSLQQLVFLSLNSNSFIGKIPASIGNLSNLYWLDLTDNQLDGTIPVSDEVSPGLDMLVRTGHFHLGKNKLSGRIPEKLFSSDMKLIHVLFDSNQLTGPLPSSLGLVKTLEVIRFDRNFLFGTVPSNLNNLTNLSALFLSNNRLTGPIPNLTNLTTLSYLDMSNNKFDPSPIPSWFSTLQSLTTLTMDRTELESEVPATIFSLNLLQTVDLKQNRLNGTFDIGASHSSQLLSINLQSNSITAFTDRPGVYKDITIILAGNPICLESGDRKDYCRASERDSLYSTPPNNCLPTSCSSDQISSPTCQDSFNRTGISMIGYFLSNPTYLPPEEFRPLFFIGSQYLHFTGETRRSVKSTCIGVIIGTAAGGCVLLLLLVLAEVYAYHRKRRAEKANDQNPFAHWDQNKSSGSIPQLKGARCFSFEELNKYTNHFSDTNEVGSGGYGKVYRATLPSGQLIAIKRAQHGSMQGEQMLIYEYIPNGSVRDSLSGKTGIRLDWLRRLKIALGAARGLSYLHELADPPIIHRDVKSTNIMLDERLTAKVADFGLSKPMGDSDKDHITTQVKGTMGYLDPEYYMTNQLTEKSDVYSFGVLMLEILTGRRPIERGKYIVREIKMAMDKKKDLYNLYEILDPTIGLGTTLKGFEKFVDLSLRCVEESGADRPSMSEVVKEIEYILQLAGLNPNAESAASSADYDDASKGYQHPYGNESFDYSGGFPASKIEPQ